MFTSAVRNTFGGSCEAALKGTLNAIKSTELCIDADTIHAAYGSYKKPSWHLWRVCLLLCVHHKCGILLKGGGIVFHCDVKELLNVQASQRRLLSFPPSAQTTQLIFARQAATLPWKWGIIDFNIMTSWEISLASLSFSLCWAQTASTSPNSWNSRTILFFFRAGHGFYCIHWKWIFNKSLNTILCGRRLWQRRAAEFIRLRATRGWEIYFMKINHRHHFLLCR